MTTITRHAGVALAVLLVAACGTTSSPGQSSAPTGDASPTPRPTSTSPQATPTDEPSTSSRPRWDLVLMGDTVLLHPGPSLRSRFEADLGVSLEVHDWVNPDPYDVGGERSDDLLARLRTDEALRTDIREAEIVVFDVPVGIINDLCPPPDSITAEQQRACFGEVVPRYEADVDAIFTELVALRDPGEAMIRVTDVWQFYWRTLHRVGDYDVVRSAWQSMNRAVADAAARHEIPLVPAYESFTGPDGERDLESSGDVFDQIHLSPQGIVRFVDLVASLGYAPLR